MENEDNKSHSMSPRSTAKIVLGVLCLISSAFFLLGFILTTTQENVLESGIAGHVIMFLFTILLPLIVGITLVFKR